jgi:NADH-quinone oxidoreductase subunit C
VSSVSDEKLPDPAPNATPEPTEVDAPIVAGKARSGMFGVADAGDTSGYGGLRLPAYSPAQAERPYGGWFDELADELLTAFAERGVPADAIQQVSIDRGEITFYVHREHLVETCRTLRDDPALRFELCSSVSAVDYGPELPQRLHSVYHLTSMTYRRRIRLEVAVDVDDPHVPSVVGVYPTADWQEREAWDMFGIVYDGHPALTRILMPDDWDGHPQRKDYPLGGIPVEYKGAEIPPPDQRRAYS